MTTPKRTIEPYIWLLFSGGGMVAALVLPVLILVLGLLIPLGVIDAPSHADLLGLFRNPLSRLFLLGVSALALVHAAHRIRFTVQDALRLHRFDAPIALLCYGGALAGTAAAAYVLIGLL